MVNMCALVVVVVNMQWCGVVVVVSGDNGDGSV